MRDEPPPVYRPPAKLLALSGLIWAIIIFSVTAIVLKLL